MTRLCNLLIAALVGGVLAVTMTSGAALAHEDEHVAESQGFQYTNELLIGVGVIGVVATSGLGYWLHRRWEDTR